MQVGAAGSGGGYADALVSVLQSSQELQGEMVEKLLAATIEQTAAIQKMEVAGQIIDVYA